MSDEQSPSTAATDDPGAADDVEADDGSSEPLGPSGGPQRVVSDQSVDDILDSLDATKAKSTDSSDEPTATSEPSGTVTTAVDEDDEDEVPTADEEVGATTDGSTPDEPTADDTAPGSDEEPDSNDATSIDTAASSLPDDASLEDLAARVDDGTVTGADVRAAEAGDGRESTPEIDDIDLSMNDLETTETGANDSGGDIDVPDAGPLAGSVDRDANGGASDESADNEPGLFGRLKQFFSR